MATHDLAPEMKTKEIADEIITTVKNGKYHFILTNLANMDIIGHTGKMKETITAAETIDSNLGRIIKKIEGSDYVFDGNLRPRQRRKMFDPKVNQPLHGAHGESSPVYNYENDLKLANIGKLCDVAPTILQIIGIDKPKAMTGSFVDRK